MRTLNVTARMLNAHGDLVKAWLNGESIQFAHVDSCGNYRWEDVSHPQFRPNTEYRVAPKITNH